MIQENRGRKIAGGAEKAVLTPHEGAPRRRNHLRARIGPGPRRRGALEAGDYVTADLRLTVSAGLRVDESALTGESEPVEKHAETLTGDGDLPLGDRANLAYSGSLVTYGRGEGIVVATGMETQLGAIAGMLGSEEGVETPLQRRMADLGKSWRCCASGYAYWSL